MKMRWYQEEAVEAAWQYLCGKAGNPIIVLPTGAGKSLVIAALCDRAVRKNGRVLVLAHRKELIEQNADKVRALLPAGVSLGIYSAGLRSRCVESDVVCAGIQSVFERAEEFGPRHLVLIDEAHLVPIGGDGMYRRFLDRLRALNPKLRVIGLTATPFRTDSGTVCRADYLFHDVAYEAKIRPLIDEGFLSRLTNRPSTTKINLDNISMKLGEFVMSQVENRFMRDEVFGRAVAELVANAQGRKSVLAFGCGVVHADQVRSAIERMTGEEVGLIVGTTLPLVREATIRRFRDGDLRWLVNCDVLTTGFDAPNIDCIGVLRATCSPGLFAQMVGRGLRISPGKEDCLVLDFGANIERHGALDDDDFGRKPKQNSGGDSEAPSKQCPNCREMVHAAKRECPDCGFQFPLQEGTRHGAEADMRSSLLGETTETHRWFDVHKAYACVHRKKTDPDAPPTMRVDYILADDGTDTKRVSEWVCLEHVGYPKGLANQWWAKHSLAPQPYTVEDGVRLFGQGFVGIPRRVYVDLSVKFPRILQREMDELPEYSEQPEFDEWAEEAPF
jgi:DNA repair protein RadD